jgi:nucleotide-binding universal stress UspA family protein
MTLIAVCRGEFQLSLLSVSLVNMPKSILCAIDFSESSLNALKWAADLSAKFNTHLTVLYPYRLLQTGKEDVVEIKKKNVELATRKFEVLEGDYLNGKVKSFEFSPEVGFLSDRIEDHLRKNSVLMMVIGKNMNSANQENLDDLLNRVKVPVVVIP